MSGFQSDKSDLIVQTAKLEMKQILQTYKLELANKELDNVWKKTRNDVQTKSATENVNELLKKSIINENFEKLHQVPQYEVAEKYLKRQRKAEAKKTKGAKWYGLPATEVTSDVKQNLEVLKMRSMLDPKRFYKKNDLKILPKYFQVGKVVNSPHDFYGDRLKRKERKQTMIDELIANAEFNKFNKRKFREIIDQKQNSHYKSWKQARKLNRKNKK
ncbi:hypothetical protein FQA39_LY15065 [Lamprigera yunnana]|nr:hypothetical protein FQA39_LY15065 [Lamprigera yunnana]